MGSEVPVMSEAGVSKIKPQPNYPPNPTLYLSNIDWSIKKGLLKRSLLALFSRHGKVLDVICLRGDTGGGKPLRGQAWIIFESLSAATGALQAERGFVFFGRPLMVNYAKEVSDRVAKQDGTYGAKVKERRAAKRKAVDAGEDFGDAVKVPKFGSEKATVTTSVADPSSLLGQSSTLPPPPTPPSVNGSQSLIQSEGKQVSSAPSSLLLATNLPAECNDLMLAMLFKQYSGYKEVKLFGGAGTSLMGSIEFESENEATAALKALNGFKLTSSGSLNLTYREIA